jgi:hypothetical protein
VWLYQRYVGFEVLTAAAIALMMEAARTSETLVNFYQTKRRFNPEDSHLRTSDTFMDGEMGHLTALYQLHRLSND